MIDPAKLANSPLTLVTSKYFTANPTEEWGTSIWYLSAPNARADMTRLKIVTNEILIKRIAYLLWLVNQNSKQSQLRFCSRQASTILRTGVFCKYSLL
jgi:hypothetical protein